MPQAVHKITLEQKPRIDPIQLLRCLSVLLSPNGGIKSNDEVHRLASLMTKFSKKLVSKCIYIQILKCTETELLGSFMGSGGWRLAHMWLTESIVAKNWPLVRELLELLLLCPVDVDRLKTNNCPKLVKELSKDGSQAAIRALAAKLVEQWLKALRGEIVIPVLESNIPQIISEANNISNAESTLPDVIPEPSNSVDGNEETVIDSQHEIKTHEPNDVCIGELVKNEAMIASIKETTAEKEDANKEVEALPILKISLKDGKQVISKLEESESKKNRLDIIDKDHKSSKGKSKSSDSKKSDSKSSSSKSSTKHLSSSRSPSSKSSNEKHRSSSKSSSSSSSSSKDKSKDRSKESSSRSSSTSDKHRDSKKHSSKSSSSSHKSKSDKSKTDKLSKSDKTKESDKAKEIEKTKENDKVKQEKVDKNIKELANNLPEKEQNEKNKPNTDKSQPLSIHKMMKIPKISETHKKETPSISIESRKPNDPNRPKTVKTFHSKFRSHGLEEEAKPPPPRGSVMKKPSLVIPPTITIPKRQSPSHSIEAPPEKKIKTIEPTEKLGSIKLIPAKPKPVLLESDMFMDALNACATNKKEPKKRKRRTSGSKDGNPSASDASPPNTPTTVAATSPSRETKSTPFRFYKDTLEIDEEKEKEKEKPLEKESDVMEVTEVSEVTEITETVTSSPKEVSIKEDKDDNEEPHVRTGLNGIKGVLCYHKRKGPKKSIRWRPDSELEQIQYFELDETERVNVSKTFTDMKHLERVHEREVFQKARNLINDDNMEVRTTWRPLIPVDIGGAIVVDYGKNSKEREIQATRQKSVLQSLFLKSMIPDSPSDPDVEIHPHNEPTIIPLDDITGNQDTISDFRNTPWPEPKMWPEPKGGAATSNIASNNINMPPMFSAMPPFPGPFSNAQFGMAGFQGSGSGMVPPGGDWQNNMPSNVMVPGGIPPGAMVPVPGSMPPVLMNPPNMPPGLMMPPDMGPEMFGGPGQMFPPTMPPEGFNMMDNMNGPQNMFPPGFPVNMSGGPPGSESGGPPFAYGNRGGVRGRGSSHQWRGNWDGPRGRGGHAPGGWKNAKCIHFMKKGTCRSGESCPYMHPGVNCPY